MILEYFCLNWNIFVQIGIFKIFLIKLEYFGSNWNIFVKNGILLLKMEHFG